MKYASINRIFLALIATAYAGAFWSAASPSAMLATFSLLAVAVMLNLAAAGVLGTDLFAQEKDIPNPSKKKYLLLYAAILLTAGIAFFLQPSIPEQHRKTGIVALSFVLATVLVMISALLIEKRIAKSRKAFEEKAFEDVGAKDSFWAILKYAILSNRIEIPEYSNRRRWFITFATIVLLISPYFAMLLGAGMEDLLATLKSFQIAHGIPKWLMVSTFFTMFFVLWLLPSAFFYFLMGLLMIEYRQKTSARAELDVARRVQTGLMPSADPVVPGLDISGECRPASDVGGDYFDYLWLNEDKTRFGIAIADVSGKAMKAAMTAVMTSGMMYQEIGNSRTPREILTRINRPMYIRTEKHTFTAMSFAVIDTASRILSFSNAGQMNPLLLRAGSVRALKVGGVHLPLGVQEHVPYGELSEQLVAGDTLVFFTDGLPESMNEKNELFGFERIEAALLKLKNAATARAIVDGLFAEAQAFAGTARQHDDMTVVVVRVLG